VLSIFQNNQVAPVDWSPRGNAHFNGWMQIDGIKVLLGP